MLIRSGQARAYRYLALFRLAAPINHSPRLLLDFRTPVPLPSSIGTRRRFADDSVSVRKIDGFCVQVFCSLVARQKSDNCLKSDPRRKCPVAILATRGHDVILIIFTCLIGDEEELSVIKCANMFRIVPCLVLF